MFSHQHSLTEAQLRLPRDNMAALGAKENVRPGYVLPPVCLRDAERSVA